MNDEYKRKTGESDLDYGMRLIGIKRRLRPDDLDWSDIVELLELDLNPDSLRKSQDTPFGGLAVYEKMREREIQPSLSKKEFLAEKQELQKLKYEIADERKALSKIVRQIGREESLKNIAIDCIKEIAPYRHEYVEPINYEGETHLVICLSDFHLGLEINEFNNQYNSDIFQNRLDILLCEVKRLIVEGQEEIGSVYVLGLGDFIAGIIHNVIRIEARENVIKQVVKVSEAISYFLNEIARYVYELHYYDCIGNHSRVFADKDNCLTSESFDILIHHMIAERLATNDKVTIHDYSINERMGKFEIEGKNYGFCHGDTFSINTLAKDFSTLTKEFYEAIFIGHIHHLYIEEQNGTLVIANGTLAGNDSYSNKLAKSSTPSQNIFLVNKTGIKQIIPIKLA